MVGMRKNRLSHSPTSALTHQPPEKRGFLGWKGEGAEMKDGEAAEGGKQGDGAQEAGLAPGQDKHAREQA